MGGQAERQCGEKQDRCEAVCDKVPGALVRWYTRRYCTQGHAVEPGDGHRQGAARGRCHFGVLPGASGDRPIRAADRPEGTRQALEVEAGRCPVSESRAGRGRTITRQLWRRCLGRRGRLLTHPPSRSRRTERSAVGTERTWRP